MIYLTINKGEITMDRKFNCKIRVFCKDKELVIWDKQFLTNN